MVLWILWRDLWGLLHSRWCEKSRGWPESHGNAIEYTPKWEMVCMPINYNMSTYIKIVFLARSIVKHTMSCRLLCPVPKLQVVLSDDFRY
jgi:hypothetical protein